MDKYETKTRTEGKMLRRNFVKHMGGLATTVLSYSVLASAEETCMPLTPYISRCTAGIRSEMFTVGAFQQRSQWCWAASIEMVFAYHGHRVSQKRIVEETWGSAGNMPGQPEQILANLNRTWEDDRGKAFSSTGDSITANPATAAVDLNNNRPLIMGAL